MSNGIICALKDIPRYDRHEFRNLILENINHENFRLSCLFVSELEKGQKYLIAVLLNDSKKGQIVIATKVDAQFLSLTPECPQAHLFEREIFEEWNIIPEHHPWLKPVRKKLNSDFFHMEGEEVHEVAVGPVHAGIIEPGHFRFSCNGEDVFHLEIALGYQHRGVEKALIKGPNKRTIHYMETLAGDTTIGHTLAYCYNMEKLSGVTASKRAETLRAVLLELERLANHTGDLGALAQDIGYLPTSSYCGRLRGDFLNMTALLCGSRFGRGIVRPGGVIFDVDQNLINEILTRLATAKKEVENAVSLLWQSFSVRERFEGTGVFPLELCKTLGCVGIVAKSSGIKMDTRKNFPFGLYKEEDIPIIALQKGDVLARAQVRFVEIKNSINFINKVLSKIPDSSILSNNEFPVLSPNYFAFSLVEGWRGEIGHFAITDEKGFFSNYKVVDPSFHNWIALSMALRGEQISNFPLCNKSFNLSYCGHDL